MNIKLVDAVLTNQTGNRFHQIKEIYIRGNTIKYCSLDESALKKIEGTEYQGP